MHTNTVLTLAEQIAALKQQVDALTQRLEALENQAAASPYENFPLEDYVHPEDSWTMCGIEWAGK